MASIDTPTTTFLTIHRSQYKAWISEQETKYSCKFYNRMKSSNLKQSNEDYLQNGYTPSVPPPLKSGQEQTPFILCERYDCHQAGGEGSLCCNCKARFTAYVRIENEEKDMITVRYRPEHTGHVASSNNDMIPLPQEQARIVDMHVEGEEETPSANDLLEQEAAYARFFDAYERLKAEVEKIMAGEYSVPAHVLHKVADSIERTTNELKRWNDAYDPSCDNK